MTRHVLVRWSQPRQSAATRLWIKRDGEGQMYGQPSWVITSIESHATRFTVEDAVAFILCVEEHVVEGSRLWVEC